MKQKIIFFGSGDYSIPAIDMLQRHGLVFVLTTETTGPLISYLKSNFIPFASTHVDQTKNLTRRELWQSLPQYKATLGVLASFGAIIPQSVIDMFPQGIWNIHPSLLPKYKGPSPIQATLLSGDSTTGVTIIKLDDQVDHGPILAQEIVPLEGDETLYSLKQSLFAKGSELIEKLLIKLENDEEVPATPQDHTQETFTEKITREHGYIDYQNPPNPQDLDHRIRAYYPWPGVWTKASLYGKEKIIKLLPDGKIHVEGKRIMTYKEFLNGYQKEGKYILEKLQLIMN